MALESTELLNIDQSPIKLFELFSHFREVLRFVFLSISWFSADSSLAQAKILVPELEVLAQQLSVILLIDEVTRVDPFLEPMHPLLQLTDSYVHI